MEKASISLTKKAIEINSESDNLAASKENSTGGGGGGKKVLFNWKEKLKPSTKNKLIGQKYHNLKN